VFPNLITHVATTAATVADNQITGVIDDGLAAKDLAPGRHYADSGYLSAALVVSEAARHGIALIGPLLADTSAQARAGNGYARADFTIDYDTQTVTCPQGKRAATWIPCTQHGKDKIVATFSAADCVPCPARSLCTASRRRQLSLQPRDLAEAQAAVRAAGKQIPFQADYARRAGVEGTRPPATAPAVPATAACPKPASTTPTWPAPSTCSGYRPTGPARRKTASEPATWHASNSASPPDQELTTRIISADKTLDDTQGAAGSASRQQHHHHQRSAASGDPTACRRPRPGGPAHRLSSPSCASPPASPNPASPSGSGRTSATSMPATSPWSPTPSPPPTAAACAADKTISEEAAAATD
jgi:hypothetical protein